MGEDWVKDIAAGITEIRVTLAKQHVTLEEHIRRTEVNESAIEKLRSEMSPLKTHVAVWGALGKVLGALGTLAGIGAGLAKLLGG